YTIKAAGNTSFKDENILYVKASGTSLATVTADDFVALNMVSLLDILNSTNINELLREENTQFTSTEIYTEKQDEPSHNILNKNILEAMLSAKISQQNSNRPSIESILHAMFPYKYVLHLHPVIVNALTCSKNGESVCKKLFNNKAIWIKAVPPGPELAILCNAALTEYANKTGSFPQIVFMQNHGVFVAANSVNEIDELMQYVTNTIKNEIKDFTLITAPEKPLTPDQVLDSSDKSVLENAAKIASYAESFGGVLPLTDDIIDIIKLVYG
ncbi:MAG: class II aldolase/adducin family protein, partial [Oscillospiraceae bacterium]|nr:class II aldolase/adducin family protein [Oscillospiraceae bacterium]